MSYSLFPAKFYDVYTIRIDDGNMYMEMCWCEEKNTPYLRAPGFKKDVPSELIDRENTFCVINNTAIQVLSKNDDPKLIAVNHGELLTLLRGHTTLISESTERILAEVWAHDPLRTQLKLPAYVGHPGFPKHIADCDALQAKLMAIHTENTRKAVDARKAEAARKATLEAELKAEVEKAKTVLKEAEAALAGHKRARDE